jgi:diacylglycerol kinase (ATP)
LYHVIINPTAGNGRALKARGKVEAELHKRGLSFQTSITKRPGHATELARRIASEESEPRVVVVGGDGSFNEVANGLVGSQAVMYFVSCGTGNDYVRVLNLPKDPVEAFALQLGSSVRSVDAGLINDRLFLNVSGTGFDIEVLRQMRAFSARFRGLICYLLGLISALRLFKPIEARITLDGRTFTQKLTIFEVANGRYFGGGMMVSPLSDPADGLFDIVYVDAVSRWQILRLLPMFVTGKFLSLPITHHLRAKEVVIESPGMTIELDGELVAVDRAHYRIVPGGLRIACP